MFNGVRTVDGNTFIDLTFSGTGSAFAGKIFAAVQFDTVLVVDGEGNLSVRF